MADSETVAQFVAFTDASSERAAQYLQLTDGNLEQAIQLFYDSPDLTFGTTNTNAQPPTSTGGSRPEDAINLEDSDDNMSEESGYALPRQIHPTASTEDDEAMARRLQEEMYGGGGSSGMNEGVRAPIERTTETLVGPGASWGGDSDDMRAAITEQLLARQRRPRADRPGIFNQRPTQSVWDNDQDPNTRQRELAEATGGASRASAKSGMLAEMYRPPFEIMSMKPWDDARDQGKEEEKWLLVDIQDSSVFDCQRLNRDIWKNDQIKETIKENFIFMQYSKDDPRGDSYINYYFHNKDIQAAYPHIAIVDPRTGEQVKLWSGPPVPEPMDFLMQLHEFLDRYSLKADARNPVANRKPQKKNKDVARMSEEEMMEMALRNSLTNNDDRHDDDPDDLTKKPTSSRKGKERAVETDRPAEVEEASTSNGTPSLFSTISSENPHTEPPNSPDTTRIQFRYSGGRQVRRFLVNDPVRRIYEWLKATPLEGKDGQEFELVFINKNLIESLDSSIEEAGLKNGSVLVGFIEG
ncbi:hypothetical protein M501DRAFT_1012217 [Patellaria atrata CBS 101060]|uniref:UBX domain-containing protein n=1 Tax=Patellaria atrata CBS 101060 TaxID=1346257 RepID=A0A9P4SHX9_9PEZI|nr:hypothetical protein M501DRAFT_1012217 [Patellaria atrata CBS 101060]